MGRAIANLFPPCLAVMFFVTLVYGDGIQAEPVWIAALGVLVGVFSGLLALLPYYGEVLGAHAASLREAVRWRSMYNASFERACEFQAWALKTRDRNRSLRRQMHEMRTTLASLQELNDVLWQEKQRRETYTVVSSYFTEKGNGSEETRG